MARLSLAEYQALFSRHLLEAKLDENSLRFLGQIEPQFTGDTEQEARLRLGIYRNNVIFSLRSALGDLYPVIKRLIGDDCFNAIAVEFIRLQPPSEPALVFYGKGLIDFLSSHTSVQELPYLKDVARLEYAHHVAFNSEDVAELAMSKLSTVAAEQLGQLCLIVQPSVHTIQSIWPIATIWHENLKEQPQEIALSEQAAEYVLVYRRQMNMQVVNLDPNCFSFLTALMQGQTINQAWFNTKQQAKELQLDLADDELSPMLGYLLGLGIFNDCVLKT